MSSPGLVVISGPSGAGKTTLVRRLLADPACRRAVTATTRAPRKEETDGVAYHFKTREEFAHLRDSGGLVEWAEVHGEWYGTPKGELLGRPGSTTLLDIDVQGFRNVRAAGIPMMSVFIAPPSLDVLRERLSGRHTESEEQVRRRLEHARIELMAQKEYDHVLVNRDIDETVRSLRRIIGLPPAPESPRDP